MRLSRATVTSFSLSLMVLATTARAQGRPWKHPDGTTHWYEAVAVSAGITWDAANAQAHAAGGYLVTITSSQEADFVFTLIDDARYWAGAEGPWTGGVQLSGSVEPAGGWTWAEGESLAFLDWSAGKPDNLGGADRIHFGGAPGRVRTWADLPASTPLQGYVIERSGPTVPRTLGLLQRDAGSFDGYTLLAPLASTATYLLDPPGRVVHSWQSPATPGLSVYLLPNGRLLRSASALNSTFTIGGAGGAVLEYDWGGGLLWGYFYSSPTYCQHHDVRRLPNGNTLILAWELKTRAEALGAGRDPALLSATALYPDHIVEVAPTGPVSGQIVWEWHAWDHLIQDFDSTKANYGSVAQHPELVDINYPPAGRVGSGLNDWMHSNAVAYNASLDQIVVSVRHFSEFWVIDHSTTTAEAAGHGGGRSGHGGDLLYRWGNPEAYRAGTPTDRQLFEQHDVHWIDDALPGAGHFLVFNNGLERPTPYSSAVEVTPPATDPSGNYPRTAAAWGPMQPTWIYQAQVPGSFFSQFVGGADRLPNGNTLICSGMQGSSFEVTPQGNVVWGYLNPVNTNTGSTLQQGDVPVNNLLFRSPRYAPGYAAFAGRTLTPGEPLDTQATVLLADGSSVPHSAPIGTRVDLELRSKADAGRLCLIGTSATPGLVPVDYRFLRIGWDSLLEASLTGALPTVFQGYVGSLDAQGSMWAGLVVPPIQILAGLELHTTFFAVDWASPNAIGTMGNDLVITLTR